MENFNNGLSLSDYCTFISASPIFCLLNNKDVLELAKLLKEKQIDSDTQLIKEGNAVDCIYFIVKGEAEVTRRLITLEKSRIMHIATLTTGDIIGVTESSLFSPSGIRSATVTAITPMHLLILDLKDFVNFLQMHSNIYPALKTACENVLLTNFIKKIPGFNTLSDDLIHKVFKKIKKLNFKKNEVIFNQGDVADHCYGILRGKVAIVSQSNDNEITLETLEPLSIFGEAAFIKKSKRNAGARAITDCELFVLQTIDLKAEKDFIESVSIMQIKQIRPISVKGISVIKEENSENSNIFLYNPATNKKLSLSLIEYSIWEKIDGNNSLQDLLNKINNKNLSLQKLHDYVVTLEKWGFVKIINTHICYPKENFFQKLFNKISFLLEKKARK